MSRYVERNSLYLDLGRPEFNGRLSTLSNASFSILTGAKADTESLVSPSTPSKSNFAKKVVSPTEIHPELRKSSGTQNVSSQMFLKTAIFNNIRRNSELGDASEAREGEIDETPKISGRMPYKVSLTLASKGMYGSKLDQLYSQREACDDSDNIGDEDCVLKKDLDQMQRVMVKKDSTKMLMTQVSTKVSFNTAHV